MFPIPFRDAAKIIQWTRDNVAEESLTEQGIEAEVHVTVLYGFDGSVTSKQVGQILAEYSKKLGRDYLSVQLGEVSFFKGNKEYDVLKLSVDESEDLRGLNELLLERLGSKIEQTHPFNAHLTLAYVKPGSCDDLEGVGKFKGDTHSANYLVYSTPESKEKVHLGLDGKLVSEGLIGEGVLSGEWWIFEHGDVHYCDGNVGDVNHEGYAMDTASRKVLDAMNLDSDDEYVDADTLFQRVREAASEELDPPPSEDLSDRQVLDLMAKQHGVDVGLIEVALGGGDPRAYAMEHWGWHALRGDTVETWALTPEALKAIQAGVETALDQDGIEPDSPEYLEGGINIATYRGRRHVEISFADLEAGNFGSFFGPAQQGAVPSEQVKKLDRADTPDFYGGQLGDSVAVRLVNRLLEGFNPDIAIHDWEILAVDDNNNVKVRIRRRMTLDDVEAEEAAIQARLAADGKDVRVSHKLIR